MADTLYFSRDTKVYVAPLDASGDEQGVWEIPVLDGFSFSQSTNTSEVTLNEMSDSSGNSRRGRQMFTDSYAPAEWSFSTYARPFKSSGTGSGAASDISGQNHAVEEVLWAMMVGDAAYSNAATSGGAVATLSGVVTFTALSGNNKLGEDSTFILSTTSDGDGAGAQILLTYTEETGAIVATLSTETGSGYTAADKLFIGRQAIAAALNVPLAAIVTSDGNNDFEATVATVATASGGTTFTGFTRDSTDLNISFANSNKVTLGTANIYFVLGGAGSGTKTVYKVSNCCVNEASLEFDIDGIATIAWSGMGTIISEVANTPTATVTEGSLGTNNFIRNRLTNLAISSTSPTATTYDLVLTGGNVTISNNMTFLTPETLGTVNQPLGHVTGTRSVSGSFTCYLNADSNSSADLFENIIENTNTITNNFSLTFNVGGSTGTPRISIALATCHLEVPSHSIDDVISLETNFHALPSTIDGTNEIAITYIGA